LLNQFSATLADTSSTETMCTLCIRLCDSDPRPVEPHTQANILNNVFTKFQWATNSTSQGAWVLVRMSSWSLHWVNRC